VVEMAKRGQYFDDSRIRIADPESLCKVSGQRIKVRASRMDEEKMYFKKMKRKMVAYEPSEWETMAEVVKLILDTLVDVKGVGIEICTQTIR
jgi:hypothetical protein